MSSNPKQSGSGGPQTQRFTSSPYQPITQTTNRTDGFGVPNQPGPYPPQQQQQQPGVNQQQGPPGGLRSLPPPTQNGPPPNQAPTPPNADQLKVQNIQPSPSMNHMFVPHQQVRPAATTYYQRTAGPTNQGPRMPNHNNRPQQPPLFSNQPQPQYVLPPMYITSNTGVPFSYPTQRPPGAYVQQIAATQVYGPPIAAYNPYNSSPNPPNQVFNMNNYYSTPVMRPPSAPPVNPNPTQNIMPNVPLPPAITQHQPTFQRHAPNKRRANALAIIDPDTGADRLQEIYEDNISHPPSGDSSARQTPQPPSAAQNSHNKEVQAAFAKQVMQALERPQEPQVRELPPTQQQQQHHHHQGPPVEVILQNQVVHNHVEQQVFLPAGPPPPNQQLSKLEQVVQTSKLQACAKEFVLPGAAAKETPIVSANCDAVEVTLPNKLPKDRESPVKGRPKARSEQPQLPPQPQAAVKEAVVDKEVLAAVKDEIPKPVVVQPTPPQAEPPISIPPPAVVQATPKETPKESHPADKKKKDSKAAVAAPAPAPQYQTLPQDSGNNPKKQNAQRAAPKQQQQAPAVAAAKQNNNQVKAAVTVATPVSTPVPQPQPPKTASKTHKKHDLNQKGANKEGTDMDAFNDNAHLEGEVNSNVITTTLIEDAIPAPTVNDIINANSISAAPANNAASVNVTMENSKNAESPPQPEETATPTVVPPLAAVTTSAAVQPQAAATTTVKPPPEPTVKKSSFNITDIVREKPKPFVSPAAGASQDEPDRAAAPMVNEKLAVTKTEGGTKAVDGNKGLDAKLPYKEGQWSPANPSGSKVYQPDFLLSLKDIPASRIAPDNIPDVIFQVDENKGQQRISDGRSSMGGRSDFNPSFNFGSRSNSQRGAISKRPSQGKSDNRNNKTSKPPIKVSLSLREDVKLHETENAWRPARYNRGENATADDKKTEALYRKVRGVLNKLTPQKFETLLMQIKGLPIDTSARLQGVIDLVFEKAVDEPNFSVAYALMCKELALMQVPSPDYTLEKPEYVHFRKLLITRCQVEFEKNSVDEVERFRKVEEIEATMDTEKKKELTFELEEYDRRLRMKSVGNIRFIGELFKQNMLTVNIMMRCLANLLENRDEESLECLCKLLTTIGKELESKQVNLQSIFGPIRDIITKKDAKISSRIRFMLQDVVDLRQSKWVPRRQDFVQKTIDQIQKEAADEHMNIQMMNSGPMPQHQQPRKDDRMGGGNDRRGGGGGGGGRGGNKAGEDGGWITMGNNKSRTNDRYASQNDRITVQKDKLKIKGLGADEPLGTPTMFGTWGKGSVGSNTKAQPPQMTNTANMYAALETIDSDKRMMYSRPGINKDSYHSKGNSLERNYNKYDGGRGSRSGSQHRPNEGGLPRRSSGSMGPPPLTAAPPQRPAPTTAVAPTPQPVPTAAEAAAAEPAGPVAPMTRDQINRRVMNALDEFISGNCSINEYFDEISYDIPKESIREIISDCYLHVLEKNPNARLNTGSLFAALVSQGKIEIEDYCYNLEDVLSQVEDLRIDIPKIWDYLAELMVDLVCMEAVSLQRLHKSCQILIDQQQAHTLLAPLFKLVVSKKGPNFLLNVWNKSGLQLTDFMDSSLVHNFVSDNQFEFLEGGATSAGQSLLSYEDIQQKLLEFLKANSEMDEITNWVTANVGDRMKEKMFIRSLATAIFQDSIEEDKKLRLVKERLTHHMTLLVKYVDNHEDYELQCLYALQALINRLEHPSGLLLSICETIYERLGFSQETFLAWETSADPAEQEGKGVALKQLTAFFCQMRENVEDGDEEESTGSEPDA